jgi:hypothetical protein
MATTFSGSKEWSDGRCGRPLPSAESACARACGRQVDVVQAFQRQRHAVEFDDDLRACSTKLAELPTDMVGTIPSSVMAAASMTAMSMREACRCAIARPSPKDAGR